MGEGGQSDSAFRRILHSSSLTIGRARPQVFLCGDDAGARTTIGGLVNDIGCEPIDAGPLELARYTEPACMLLVQLAYMRGFGARIGLTLARDAAEKEA